LTWFQACHPVVLVVVGVMKVGCIVVAYKSVAGVHYMLQLCVSMCVCVYLIHFHWSYYELGHTQHFGQCLTKLTAKQAKDKLIKAKTLLWLVLVLHFLVVDVVVVVPATVIVVLW